MTMWVNPLSPDIKMHILLTVFHTFLMELVRRICLNIKTSYPSWSLPLFLSLECSNKESPRGITPRHCSPPRDVKYVAVTQDKSPCLCSERHGEYLFGRAKTGGLGQLTTKKKHHGKKMAITRPRPDGKVTSGDHVKRNFIFIRA